MCLVACVAVSRHPSSPAEGEYYDNIRLDLRTSYVVYGMADRVLYLDDVVPSSYPKNNMINLVGYQIKPCAQCSACPNPDDAVRPGSEEERDNPKPYRLTASAAAENAEVKGSWPPYWSGSAAHIALAQPEKGTMLLRRSLRSLVITR